MKIHVEVFTHSQLLFALESDDIAYVYTPLELITDVIDTNHMKKIVAVPPVFLGNAEEAVTESLIKVKKYGINKALAHTLGHIELYKDLGFQCFGNFRLNIANSLAEAYYEELGLKSSVLSVELSLKKAISISHNIPTGILAYGYMPLMITRICPVSGSAPCGKKADCAKSITDRHAEKFDILCHNDVSLYKTVEILNPIPLVLSDKMRDIEAFNFIVLRLSEKDNIEKVLDMYKKRINNIDKYTRGLYYKGVTIDEDKG